MGWQDELSDFLRMNFLKYSQVETNEANACVSDLFSRSNTSPVGVSAPCTFLDHLTHVFMLLFLSCCVPGAPRRGPVPLHDVQ